MGTAPSGHTPESSGVPSLPSINEDHELSYIAEVTARDHAIKFVIGERGKGSFADTDAKIIVIDPDHCATREEQRGVAAHEGRHILITPSLSALGFSMAQIREFVRKTGTLSGRNLVEDFAVNDGIVRDFPVRAKDILSLYPDTDPSAPVKPISHPEVMQIYSRLGFIPRFAVALGGLLNDWAHIRKTQGFDLPLNEYLAQPFSGGTSDDPDIASFLQRNYRHARQAGAYLASASATGHELIEAGKARFSYFNNLLYPELQKLFEKDIQELAQKIKQALQQQMQEGADQGAQDGTQADKDGRQDGSDRDDGKLSREARRQAQEQLSELDDAIRDALKGFLDGDALPTSVEVTHEQTDQERASEAKTEHERALREAQERLRKSVDTDLSDYFKEYREVAEAIERAHGELAHEFIPHSHVQWRRRLSSGARIDLLPAMGFDLSGEGHDGIFKSKIDPTKPDLAIAVLVDTSGSMGADNKYMYARRAAIFARELFQRLSIATCCISFNESPAEFLAFDDDLQDESVQKQLLEATSKPSGSTKDETALRFAEEKLEECHARQKAIIMISDAESGEASSLPLTVQRLESIGIPVLHFGLGRGTTDRSKLYTRSWGDLRIHGEGDKDFLGVFCREMVALAHESFFKRRR